MSQPGPTAPTVRPPSPSQRPLAPTRRPPKRAASPEPADDARASAVRAKLRRRRRDPTLVHEGARIGNKFRLIAQIGDGGMGKVWLALHLGLQRRVALKVLHRQVHADDGHRRRFEREAVAIGRLCHPGIVDALDFGELEDGRNFLAMEYVEGETLATLLRREGRLGWRTAARLGAQVADALAFAHRHGVIHRDLKPDNLIVEGGDVERGRVRVLDLGLARIEGAPGFSLVTERNLALGTASYSAPEQLRGEPTGPPADVYGLGAVLYRLITGQPPYPGESFAEVVTRQHRGPPPPPAAVRPDPSRPVALDELLMRCLAPSPGARPGSLADVRDALCGILARGAEDAGPAAPRWRTWAVGAALVALGVAAGVVGAALAWS